MYGSSGGGGSVRRKSTRRTLQRAPSTRAVSVYDEEDDDYLSGDFEDAPFELIKIRVKVS